MQNRTMMSWVVLTNVQDVHFREFDCTNRNRGYKRVLLTLLTIRIVGKVGLMVSREPSSIFILSEEDYNSPAATFSNLLHGPAVVARPRERRQLRRLVGRVALTLSPSRENVRSAKVESRSVSRRAGVVSARRQRMKSERRASTSVSIGPAADSIFVSVRHNFPFACVLPNSQPTLRAFRNHLTLLPLPHSLSLLFLPVTVFSTSELSYPRPGREPVNVDMCCIISRYFDTPCRRLGSRRYCGILNRELRRESSR